MIRKTISLDADVAELIEGEATTEERPFSQVLNRKLRALLKMPIKPVQKRQPRKPAAV